MCSILRRHMEDDDAASEKAVKVLVAVRGTREISRAAIHWALAHVVQPGDGILLLVLLQPQSSGRKLWGFPIFSGDCASSLRRPYAETILEQTSIITDSCSQMMRQLHDAYASTKIKMKIKLVSESPSGAVAAEAKRVQTNWVVLDKQLKNEKKICLEELQCNIVAMNRLQPKVLRLNLGGSPKSKTQMSCQLFPDTERHSNTISKHSSDYFVPVATSTSSLESETPFTYTEIGASSLSSSDPGTSPFFISMMIEGINKKENTSENHNLDVTSSGYDCGSTSPSAARDSEILRGSRQPSKVEKILHEHNTEAQISTKTALLPSSSKFVWDVGIKNLNYKSYLDFCGSIREAISLSRNAPSGSPLCSVCQYKAPVFRKPPRHFTYAELELATGKFSFTNFLAEGGFGTVHTGILPDGQKVAVKQLRLATPRGDRQFCSEVEVLSCAQHRNVVMLIGFCVEDRRRLLVYEYICNGSLYSHLYGHEKQTLVWSARKKIAVGAARGLRYLHEECRVGCIVHHDMRTQNILVTHDFEPLVGDFGLARWQPDGDLGLETQVVATVGYVAPEYKHTSQITEKADVYSFGVVLLELVTGQEASDITRPVGQQYLTEWACPLLEECAINELIDPRLGNNYSEHEVYRLLYSAYLCIRLDPGARPRMSQVLRILEGNVDPKHLAKSGFDPGSKSRRMH